MTAPVSAVRLLMPGAYWFGRYASTGSVAFLYRLGLVDGSAMALIVTHPVVPARWARLVVAYLVARAAYVVIYEIGYFVNDFWSARREGQTVTVPSGSLLFVALATRSLAAGGLLRVLASVWGPALAWTTGCLLVAVVVFGVHNAIFFPGRIVSFAVLYLNRYALAVPLLALDALPTAIALWTALTAGFVLKYWADRTAGLPPWGVWNRTRVTLILRVAALLLVLVAAAASIAPVKEHPSASTLLAFAAALVAADAVYVFAQVTVAVHRAFRRDREEVRHVHTRLSHDATLEVEQLARFVQESGRARLFLSEHAEDVGPEELEELRGDLAATSADIRPGVEVTVLDQHVLLEEVRRWDGPQSGAWPVSELRHRRADFARALWAHPHFSIRRMVLDRGYRRGFVELARAVDGVEILNRKSDRTLDHLWRSLLVGALTVADRACCLTVGLDAHHAPDLRRVGSAPTSG